MTLEDHLFRLTNAIGALQPDVAVKEIIRQRDEALRELSFARNSAGSERVWKENARTELAAEQRKNASLRGVITRMKNKAERKEA